MKNASEHTSAYVTQPVTATELYKIMSNGNIMTQCDLLIYQKYLGGGVAIKRSENLINAF